MMGGGGSRVGKASRTHTHNTAHKSHQPLATPTHGWDQPHCTGGRGREASGGRNLGDGGMVSSSPVETVARPADPEVGAPRAVPRRVLGACRAHATSLGFP